MIWVKYYRSKSDGGHIFLQHREDAFSALMLNEEIDSSQTQVELDGDPKQRTDKIEARKFITWYYKADGEMHTPEKSHDSISSHWTKYRDIEIDIIEEAYEHREPCALLDRYRIDLVRFIQVTLDDSSKQRPVRREPYETGQKCLRQNRFSASLTTASGSQRSNSCGLFDAWCPFLRAWLSSAAGKRAWYHFPSCIESCAEGIVYEASIHDSYSNTEAAYVAKRIRQCSGKPQLVVSELCIHFYTKDSFIYDVLNRALRECDLSKMETLGPLAFLISKYSRIADQFFGIVYRGVQLGDVDIEDYRRGQGSWRTWPAYTSTSKSRKMAEIYGNTLFIIEIFDIKLSTIRSYNISHLSYFPDEQEVLLPAGTSFQIKDVYQDPQQKCIIHVRVWMYFYDISHRYSWP